jgi:hypothetical protein
MDCDRDNGCVGVAENGRDTNKEGLVFISPSSLLGSTGHRTERAVAKCPSFSTIALSLLDRCLESLAWKLLPFLNAITAQTYGLRCFGVCLRGVGTLAGGILAPDSEDSSWTGRRNLCLNMVMADRDL